MYFSNILNGNYIFEVTKIINIYFFIFIMIYPTFANIAIE